MLDIDFKNDREAKLEEFESLDPDQQVFNMMRYYNLDCIMQYVQKTYGNMQDVDLDVILELEVTSRWKQINSIQMAMRQEGTFNEACQKWSNEARDELFACLVQLKKSRGC
jgi:hypothetical protein